MSWRKFLPYLFVVFILLVVAYAYFAPLLTGKVVEQHDRDQWRGTAQECLEYAESHDGEQTLWTSTVFSGMPSVLISLKYPLNVAHWVDDLLLIGERPASYIFLTMLGFYFLLIVMGVRPLLAIPGAIAYGFSTYFFIIIGAGHNAKSHAIAYIAPLVAAALLTYKGKYALGGALFALVLALSLVAGHPQITYYSAFIVAAVAISSLVNAVKARALRSFAVASAILLLAAMLAVGANFNSFYNTWDYGRYSIRGETELTHAPHDETGGLDRSYALAWSYGIGETLNMVVPNLMGGSSSLALPSDSHAGRLIMQQAGSREVAEQYLQRMPMYWGSQPMTSGPVYIGAVVFFLFVLAMFTLRGPVKYALLAVTVLSILLAWGSHLEWFNSLFLDYFPGYNKFRTVSMTLVIAEVTIPLMAFHGLSLWLGEGVSNVQRRRSWMGASIISLGCLVLVLIAGLLFFPFTSLSGFDAQLPSQFADALRADRRSLFIRDAWRSIFFVLAAAGLLLIYLRKNFNLRWLALLLSVVVLADMVPVNKRYDGIRYVSPSHNEDPFPITTADRMLARDTSYYRVLNATVSPFNDASTSFRHRSVGGYHGAKLRRYQEFIDAYAQNPLFLDILNVKYVIQPSKEYGAVAASNAGAYGPVWFVDSVMWVPNADAELAAIGNVDLRKVAVVDKRYKDVECAVESASQVDSISLLTAEPNRMRYSVRCAAPRFAVFSEVFYPKGWAAMADGRAIPIVCADYTLRGMWLPAGRYTLDFAFDLPMFHRAKYIDLACGVSMLLWLLLAATLALLKRGKKNREVSVSSLD